MWCLELSLRGRDESNEPANPGVFKSLLEFVLTMYEDMQKRAINMHSNTIQDDLLSSCLNLYKNFIINEIS